MIYTKSFDENITKYIFYKHAYNQIRFCKKNYGGLGQGHNKLGLDEMDTNNDLFKNNLIKFQKGKIIKPFVENLPVSTHFTEQWEKDCELVPYLPPPENRA